MFGFKKKKKEDEEENYKGYRITIDIDEDFSNTTMCIDEELEEIFKLYKGYVYQFENSLAKIKLKIK